ncbi:MAG TPA: protein YgfX [Gammaproteobacteria bacterium]
MSSNAYAAALRLELRPSRQRRGWHRLTHLAVLVSVPLLQSPWLMVAVLAAVAASWFRSHAEQKIILLWDSDGGWKLFEEAGESAAVLAAAPFVQSWLVILPLRMDGRHRVRHVVLFPDMLPAEEFRRLRVRLHRERAAE